MTDKTREQIEDGISAANVLKDPILRMAMEALEKDIYRKWCTATEESERTALWMEQKAAKGLLNRLRALVTDGDMARESLKTPQDI